MRTSLASCVLLLFVLTSGATTRFSAAPTTSNASLNGAYTFQLASPHQNSWGAQLVCNGQPMFVGGSDTRSDAVAGTVTFNGSGSATGTFTMYGRFNQAASNATVSCNNNGNPVYDAPSSGTISGEYSVQSNGTGAMAITITPTPPGGSPSAGFILRLAGACASGVSNTVFMVSLRTDNSVETTGIARFQSTC